MIFGTTTVYIYSIFLLDKFSLVCYSRRAINRLLTQEALFDTPVPEQIKFLVLYPV